MNFKTHILVDYKYLSQKQKCGRHKFPLCIYNSMNDVMKRDLKVYQNYGGYLLLKINVKN